VKLHIPSVIALGAALVLAGCAKPADSSFSPNQAKVGSLIPQAQAEIAKVLAENFGTPNQLVAWERFPIDYGEPDPNADDEHKIRRDAGWRLIEGRNLYMTHCVHCHGVSGDGDGPTAKFLNPLPRDYRLGKFKFKSTLGPLKPSRADLTHILQEGIPGTYMPSFVLLGEERLGLLIDYVRWLSIRGDMEIRLANELLNMSATEDDVKQAVANDESKKLSRADVVASVLKSINEELPALVNDISTGLAEDWAKAELPESVVVPEHPRTPPTKDSIDRGRKLFLSQVEGKKTKCVDCHGPLARGDGTSTEEFWPIPDAKPARKYEVPGLHDDWGHPQKPRDLTRGIYRGGRRPVDIYRRIFAGITGTQMPGFGGTILKDDEIWDVVNYVLSIPFDGKQSAYPTDLEENTEDKKKIAATRE
jgi:mono/diheme cytochrome c family protein